MADAFARLDLLSSEACRRTAETRCGIGRMTRGYLTLYEELRRGIVTGARDARPQGRSPVQA
jgi:hypothetical protein